MEIKIRPLKVEDAYTSVKWRNDKDVFKYTGNTYDHEITIASELEWIKRVIAKKDDYRCAILADGMYVGNIYLTDISGKSATYHIFIGEKEYWGKGIARKASELILDYAFTVLCLETVYLKVHKDNYSALSLYRKLGFQKKTYDTNFISMELSNRGVRPLNATIDDVTINSQMDNNKGIVIKSNLMLQEEKTTMIKSAVWSLVESGLNLIPNVPIGDILKNAMEHIGTYRDIRFAQKLSAFLCPLSEDDKIDKEKFNMFWENIGDNRKRVSQYLMGLLDAVETDEKASMMGSIYHSAVLGRITHDAMLRYCDIIRKCYMADLIELPKYVEPTNEDTITTQNLTNVGLIDNYSGGVWHNDSKVYLNEFGHKLYDILFAEGYFSE